MLLEVDTAKRSTTGDAVRKVGRPPSEMPPLSVKERVASLRERKRNEGFVTLSVQVTSDHVRTLDDMCQAENVSRSDKVKQMIDDASKNLTSIGSKKQSLDKPRK